MFSKISAFIAFAYALESDYEYEITRLNCIGTCATYHTSCTNEAM